MHHILNALHLRSAGDIVQTGRVHLVAITEPLHAALALGGLTPDGHQAGINVPQEWVLPAGSVGVFTPPLPNGQPIHWRYESADDHGKATVVWNPVV